MNNRDKALKLIDNLEKSNKKILSKQRKADIEYGYLMACKEPIDEDKLNELAISYAKGQLLNAFNLSKRETKEIICDFKAGYRKAKEEK